MSNYFLPIIILLIIIYGVIKNINVYDSFIKGAKEGIEIGISIFPSILAIIFSTRIFISSGMLDLILKIIEPIINIPISILPIIFLRPISSNASLSIMINNFTKYGVDSYIGILSSVLQGSMDTTFYIISIYLSTLGIKKTKNVLTICLMSNLLAIVLSIIIVNMFK